MEYPNSRLIDPSTYDTTVDGLCTNLPARVHCNPSPADRGALRAQRDWERAFGSLPPGFAGIMGPEFNFVSICMPEVLPERLELVAYLTEVAFLADDVIDSAQSPMAVAAPYMADLLLALDVLKRGGDVDRNSCSPVARFLLGCCKALYDIDPERAGHALRWFEEMAQSMLRSTSESPDIRDFDEYLNYRRINVASQGLIGWAVFGMGLSIPEDQQETCLDLAQSFFLHLSLANDCHSWDRECKAASDSNQASVMNAIWILMSKHSTTCDDAKAACRQRARQYATEYEQVVEAAKAREDLCQDAKILLERLKLVISGNLVWALQCPRYHPDRKLNAEQLNMAAAIWAEDAIDSDHDTPKITNGATDHPGVKTNGPLAEGAVTSGPLSSVNRTNGAPTNGGLTNTNGLLTSADGVLANGLSNGILTNCPSSPQSMAAVTRDVPALGTEVLEAPSRYIDSLPGKDIRGKTIVALNNTWYNVPQCQTAMVKKVVDLLHGASLMLDDIQDSSQLRRGKPAAHVVFGSMQTINSAGYRFLAALSEVRSLGSQRCMDIFCDELRDLYVGQGHDLAWTCSLNCPTEEEYLAMVDGKTAGLFRMLARMLDALSDSPTKPDVKLLTRFMALLGRLFQIRDDYMNLTSADYTKQKGFCEDLDEGKYSLALVHALGRCKDSGSSTADPNAAIHTALLQNLLSQRHISGRMSIDQKKLVLECLEKRGSLEYTRRAVNAIQAELNSLAEQMGMRNNGSLKELLEMLKV